MSPAQTQHEDQILADFNKDHRAKYTQGCIEHDGNLWEVEPRKLIEFAKEEAQDLVSYLYTLDKQHEKALQNAFKNGYSKGYEDGKKELSL